MVQISFVISGRPCPLTARSPGCPEIRQHGLALLADHPAKPVRSEVGGRVGAAEGAMFGMDLLLGSGRRGAVRSVASTRSGEWRTLAHFMSGKCCRASEGGARDRTGNSLARSLGRGVRPRAHRRACVPHRAALRIAAYARSDGLGYVHVLRAGRMAVDGAGMEQATLEAPAAILFPRAGNHRPVAGDD